jgi:replication initiation protein RepC
MSQFSDESPERGRAIRPSGARRVTLDMRVRLDQRGTAKPLRFLAAFQEAEPYLGLPVHAYKLVAWLVKQTQPQDWEEGSRPIAWPSARHEAEFLDEEFVRVAVAARVERQRMRKLRRRATLARRAIAQAGEELTAQGAKPEGWRALEEETAALAVACRGARRSDELLLVVEGLERQKIQAEEWVRKLAQPVNTDPEGLDVMSPG